MDQFGLIPVTLPEISRECLTNRPDPQPDRCNVSKEVLIGEEIGACGYPIQITKRFLATSFRQRSIETPAALRSPAYQFVRNIEISEIDLDIMLKDWASRGVDKWNYDPREAVCSWVANNIYMGSRLPKYVPGGYPREIQEKSGYNSGFLVFTIAFGAIGAFVAIAIGGATHRYRAKKQIKFAQEVFLYLFSLGFFFVCIGAIFYSLLPSPVACAARWWFVVVGFTFALVPLLIKITAINKLMNDAKKYRTTNVSKQAVYKIVAAVVLVVLVYLAVWTAVDPPIPEEIAAMRHVGGSTVDLHLQCASNSMVWEIVAFTWEAALICFAAAVAFQSRHIAQAFNESKVVARMAYTFFLFLVFRLFASFLPSSILEPSIRNGVTSILLTLESLVAELLYFGPKFLSIYQGKDDSDVGESAIGQAYVFSGSETCRLCEQQLSVEAKENVKRNSEEVRAEIVSSVHTS